MGEVKAYAVTEKYESTGGIVFAKHAVVARRMGADIWADGEFSEVSCRRARWADHCAETGIVPAGLCVENGWHFECTGCGRRIDSDMAWLYEDGAGDPETCDEAVRYKGWTPDQVIGSQHSAVFCDQRCEDEHIAHEAERKRVQDRWIERFKKIVMTRFPDAVLIDDPERYRSHHHAYAFKRDGRWHIEQVAVAFTYPGMKYGPAMLEYLYRSPAYWRLPRRPEKPHFTCCGGDKDAFEAWAASVQHSPRQGGEKA